jgi:aspartyl-tRNA(Asn)/glutamyl-tRNA(Gln) amidotransferase subunit A
VPEEYFGEGLSAEVRERVEQGIAALARRGAVVKPIQLPHSKYALAVYYIIQPSECSANLARYDGIRYGFSDSAAANLHEVYTRSRAAGFGVEPLRRIMLGTYALSAGYFDAYYVKAQRVRALIRRDFDRAFEEVDVIAGPTAPTTAFKLGEKSDDPLAMYLSDIFTVPVNLAGVPAISACWSSTYRSHVRRAAHSQCGMASGTATSNEQLATSPNVSLYLHRPRTCRNHSSRHRRRGSALYFG